MLEHTAGLRFKDSQWSQLETLLHEMALERQQTPLDLLQALETNSNLSETFAARCTIPETHFYRIKSQMDALQKRVLPTLLRDSRESLRCWSAGCSTGEEVYSLIILMLETMGHQSRALQVLGTDLSETSLERARAGLFKEWSFRDTPLEWRSKYFEPVSDDGSGQALWRIADRVRKHAAFQQLNLQRSAWSIQPQFDLILCRNVTIYFSAASAERLYERLAARLALGGWLLLGPSDPQPSQALLERAQLSVVLESNATLFRKLNTQIEHESPAPMLRPRATPSAVPAMGETPIAQATQIFNSAQQALLSGLGALEQDPQRAIEHLRRAAYLEPRDAVIQFAKARALSAVNEPRRAWAALRQAERALEGVPDEVVLSLNTGAGRLREQLENLKYILETHFLRR